MSGPMEVPPQRKNTFSQRKHALSQRPISIKPLRSFFYTLYLNGFRLIQEPFFLEKICKIRQ